MNAFSIARAVSLAAIAVSAGCASPSFTDRHKGNAAATPSTSPPNAGSNASDRVAELAFIDLPSFDQRLASQLSEGLGSVTITFLDRVSPSQMPERLQNWMASLESGGGKVQVRQPPAADGVTAKSPLLVISAIVSLWSAKKTLSGVMYREDLKKARAYDATLVLKSTSDGSKVLDRIVLTRRSPS